MIKINLSIEKQQFDPSNLLGIDITKVKIIPILATIFLYYALDSVVGSYLSTQLEGLNQIKDEKQDEFTKIKTLLIKLGNTSKQISELKAQEENIKQKRDAVREAIREKKNPTSLLLYLSKNIPEEVWIKELIINESTLKDSNSIISQLIVKGESHDYASIGNFVNSFRSSIFVKEANITSTSSATRESDKRRIEVFEVQFTIARFDQ
jgi:Tfp pilus assembly protein PilN